MISFSQLGSWGRLGNQMFEYAALLGIGTELALDVAIPSLGRHQLADCFEISAPIASHGDLRGLQHVYEEPRTGFSESYRAIVDGTDLRGFFQSARYFPPRGVLRDEFRFRSELQCEGDALTERYAAAGRPVVGMTVRRGDYQLHPQQFVQLWDTDFYERALARVAPLDPIVVVSSDEPEWCRAAFPSPDIHIIEGVHDYAQLAFLMSCDHLVIANSSFSWWAAWMNEGTGMTIAPSRWWGEDCLVPESARDPVPDAWIQLEV